MEENSSPDGKPSFSPSGPDDLEIRESGLAFPLTVLACCPLMLWWSLLHPPASALRLAGILLGLFAFGYAAVLLLRRRKPVMILTDKGLLLKGMQAPLPWTEITDFKIHTSGKPFTVSTLIWFKLPPEAEPPALSGDHRVQYLETGHQIQVKIVKLAGFREMEFNDMLLARMGRR